VDTPTALFVSGTGAPPPVVNGRAFAARGRFWATFDGAAPAPRAPADPPVDPATIVVCMAVHDPDPALFSAQVQSLRAQTDERWICLIGDDGSGASLEAVAGDERFRVHVFEQRVGFYRNFERLLALVPPGAELVALCDHDDRWYPDKLASLRTALGGAELVYGDMRLVAPDGRVLSDTLWRGRRNNHTDIVSLLVANSVTGAACLMRRRVVERALPFPDPPGFQFHDHWLALCALSMGEIAYVDRPLYDYVQHPRAVFGEVSGGARRARRSRGWRAAYFDGYVNREVLARTLLARGARRRRPLERFVDAERSPLAFAWLCARGFNRSTLGSEWELARGLLWRRVARWAPDTSLPAPGDFEQRRLRRWRARLAR
jgi:glycosyltransferase involved in cell wall biosynthesis